MDIFQRIIEITFPIFAIVALGLYCGYRFKPDLKVINHLNMDIFVPALIFSVLVGQSVDVRNYLPLIVAGTVVVLGSGLLVWPLCRAMNIDFKTLAPTAMFNNAGNMGLPLVILTFGEAALPIAMILFLVENTLHFTVGMAWLNNSQSKWRAMISPLTIATLIAVIIGMTPFRPPETLMLPIDLLGQVVIPLMLFSLGVRLSTSDLKTLPVGLLGGTICPLSGILLVVIIKPFVDLSPTEMGTLFLFGALPPAVLNFMFAERYQQEPEKVASIVIIGNGLSFVTLPLVLGYVVPKFT